MIDVSHYKKTKDKESIFYHSIPFSVALIPHCKDHTGQVPRYKDLPILEPPILHSTSSASVSSEDDTDAHFDKVGIS